jgi:hypothetical protein
LSINKKKKKKKKMVKVYYLTLRQVGGAQLGKAVKGRSKEGKSKKDETGIEEEKRLHDSIRRMEMNDYMNKLAISKKILLKEFMEKEEKNSKMNKLKIQNHWRKIMRLVKVESLRKEVEILSQNHERDVDRKDAIVQMLDRDLEEAEEQFQMAIRSHFLNIDELIDLQDEKLILLEKEFEQEFKELEKEFTIEKEKILLQHLKEKNELVNIMQAIEQQEKEKEQDAKQEHEQLREEIRNKNLEDINVLRITLDSTIEELEQHFETAHLNYLQNTDQRTQDFKYLTAKDQELSRDIELKIRKIERLQTSITHWRTKMTQNLKECSERNKALEEEKALISQHFQKLKTKMNQMREEHKKRLTELSMNARNTKHFLEKHLSLAERILKLGEIVRKLETEREKILPFYSSTISDERQANQLTENVRLAVRTSDQIIQEAKEETTLSQGITPNGTSVSEWESLDLFWKKYNKAVLDEMAIQREKERYENENKELQALLKQYLDGISVNNDVMNNANPLMVINGRLKLQQATTDNKKNKTIIDANHMVATNRVHR